MTEPTPEQKLATAQPETPAVAEPAVSKNLPVQKEKGKGQKLDKNGLPITPGERFYDVMQFTFGKVFILAMTAVLAFTAHQKYGPDKIGPFKNHLKSFQAWAESKFAPLAKMGEEGTKKRDFGMLMAGGLTSATILMHGGNAFSPFIKWLENNRMKITDWANKKFGTEEDVKIGHEKFKDTPKQNWMDVIKGRVAGFATVFSAISGAYMIFGRSKGTHQYFKLDTYEEWFGRKVAWISKGSRDISKVPIEEALTEVQKANKTYRFGKILAIDLFATSTAIVVWNIVSRFSAKKRADAHAPKHPAVQGTPAAAPQSDTSQEASPTATLSHADKVQPTEKLKPSAKDKSASYAEMVQAQKQTAEHEGRNVAG